MNDEIRYQEGIDSTEQLKDAFSSFNETSERLEQTYQMMASRTEALQSVLEERDGREREGRLESLGWIVAKIVHEVRNPLGSIELITSLLRKELSDDTDKKRLVDHVIYSVKNIDNILSNLLHFTRSPKPNLKMNNVEIMVQKCLEVVSYNILKNNIKIIQKLDPEIWISCDEILIRQVFVNMFMNALQAMKSGGVLTIEAIKGDPDSDVEIHISDTGSGIRPEDSERIFDPFFTTSEKGTGLGLTIVHNILKVHGGGIKVHSRAGEGAMFVIKFPAGKQAARDNR